MKKSVLMSAAKKAQITLAVMAVCGMSFVNMGNVFASYEAGNNNDIGQDEDLTVVIGEENTILGDKITVIGVKNKVYGKYVDASSNVFGYGNIVGTWLNRGDNFSNNVFGNNNTVQDRWSTAVGNNNKISENGGSAIGIENTVSGSSSLVFGNWSEAGGTQSLALGCWTHANGYMSLAVGNGDQAKGDGSFAAGGGNVATGKYSAAVGYDNGADGENSIAFGSKNKVEGNGSGSFGYNNKVTKDNAIAIGIGALANESNTISFGNAQDTTKNMRLVNIVDGKANTDAATYGQIITAIKKSADGSQLEFYTGQAQAAAKWSVDLAAAGGSLTQDEFNRMLDANSAFQDLQTDVSNKANIKGDNITTGADSKWAEKLGTGAIENGNKDLVTGGTVYDKLGAAESGNYIKDNNTVNANLKVLDEQVKTNTDAIAVNKNNIGDISNLTNAGLTSNNLSDAVVEVNNKVGTSSEMKELKDAGLGDNLAQATAAVNKKAEANKAAVERLDSRVDGLSDRVDTIGSTVNKLDSKVNKVGAGAAALAALHPLDFDPDNKLTFSAGVGNYRGENAAAIGAFYRPDEKVMFSIAGNMGNGENMLNAGITFALDRTTKTTTSKAAMARKIAEQEDRIAAQDAEIAQQKNDIAELKAIVAQLSAKVK